MSLLLHRECPHRSDRLDAAFSQSLAAQERAGRAAEGVEHASDDHRARISAEGVRIRARSASNRRTRCEPPTSDVRALVDQVLLRPGLRGIPTDRDPS